MFIAIVTQLDFDWKFFKVIQGKYRSAVQKKFGCLVQLQNGWYIFEKGKKYRIDLWKTLTFEAKDVFRVFESASRKKSS